jgi:hypothetical protein
MKIIQKHISEVKTGDTIFHNGKETTVTNKDIKSGFMGKTIFGDSYNMGRIPVSVITY